MAILIGAATTSLLIEVGLALAAFFIGMVVAAAYLSLAGKSRAAKDDEAAVSQREASQYCAERSQMAVQQLQDLALNVASDVGDHNVLVGDISNQLGALPNGGRDSAAVVADAVTRLLAANTKLQARLEDAERKVQAQAEELRTQQSEARTDSLTKLANRRAFDAAMEENYRRFDEQQRPFCVLLLDVDHFKKFNDTYGHQAGDEVLRQVGQTLTRTVKAGDLPCRYGGEEFAVVLANTKLADAQVASERVRKAIESAVVQHDGRSLRVTASVGVAEIQSSEDVKSLVRRSDEAVYASKKAGRNLTYWHDGASCLPIGAAPAPASPPRKPAVADKPELLPTAKAEGHSKLPNSEQFKDELGRRIAEGQRSGNPLSVVYFRVRDFDELTRKFGAAVGDLLIDSVAVFVRSTLREMDLLAKMGGPDMAVMLPGSTAGAAKIVGQRIKTSISHCPIPLGSQSIRLNLDMGVTSAAPSDDSTTMIREARSSLEQALQAKVGNPTELAEATA